MLCVLMAYISVCFRSLRHWSRMNRPKSRSWRIKWSRSSQLCPQRAEKHTRSYILPYTHINTFCMHTWYTDTKIYHNRGIINTYASQMWKSTDFWYACADILNHTYTQTVVHRETAVLMDLLYTNWQLHVDKYTGTNVHTQTTAHIKQQNVPKQDFWIQCHFSEEIPKGKHPTSKTLL